MPLTTTAPTTGSKPNRQFCVAPMLDWTDRHCRFFLRLISQHAVLYTEMLTTGAILYGDAERHLAMNTAEHPVALQLGGSDPHDLAAACKIAEKYAYAEINLNCGCPSDRVQNGMFGAIMMKNAEITANCISSMVEASSLPITVKHRIGVDDYDSYDFLCQFVGTVAEAGCNTFLVHARKAWLKGLSPKQNREIPPLDYDRVYRLKKSFARLTIIINGGITDLSTAIEQLNHVDGVMLGREAYQNPFILAQVDELFFGAKPRLKLVKKSLNNFLIT